MRRPLQSRGAWDDTVTGTAAEGTDEPEYPNPPIRTSPYSAAGVHHGDRHRASAINDQSSHRITVRTWGVVQSRSRLWEGACGGHGRTLGTTCVVHSNAHRCDRLRCMSLKRSLRVG